ncbi:hypothetical protein DFH09DRAFT_1336446 [Mycena vulgaris]|nr:hypothetical protein DFH09DRAFT_1336446 [Mycena vulgaris]
MLDGTGRWTGRPSTVDGRSVSSTSPNIRPSSRPLVDGTAVLPAVRRRDGGLERRSIQGRDGTVFRPSVRPTVLDGYGDDP